MAADAGRTPAGRRLAVHARVGLGPGADPRGACLRPIGLWGSCGWMGCWLYRLRCRGIIAGMGASAADTKCRMKPNSGRGGVGTGGVAAVGPFLQPGRGALSTVRLISNDYFVQIWRSQFVSNVVTQITWRETEIKF